MTKDTQQREELQCADCRYVYSVPVARRACPRCEGSIKPRAELHICTCGPCQIHNPPRSNPETK